MRKLYTFLCLAVFGLFYSQEFQKDSIVINDKDTLNYQIFKIDRTKLYIVTDKDMVFDKMPSGSYRANLYDNAAEFWLIYSKNEAGYLTYPEWEIWAEKTKKSELKKNKFFKYEIKKKRDERFYVIFERVFEVAPKKLLYQIETIYNLKNKLLTTQVNVAITNYSDIEIVKKDIYPMFADFAENRVFIGENYYPY